MPYLPLLLALALTAGIAGGVLVDSPSMLPLSLALAAGWGVAVIAFNHQWPRVQIVALAISAAAAGWLLASAEVDRAWHPALRTLLEQRLGGFSIETPDGGGADEPILIEGHLRSDAASTPTGVLLRVDVVRVWLGAYPEPAPGGVSLRVSGALQADRMAAWTTGRLLRAPVLLRRPARYFNAGLPDQERALARRGVALVGSIKSATLVEIVSRGHWWEEAAASVRARTRAAIARHVGSLDGQSGAITTAILIGDRAAIDRDVERRLQEAGTYHVIAISGGNVAILTGVVLALFGAFGMRGRGGALAAMVLVAAYAIVAAGGVSVARATLMAILYLAVRLIDQRTAAGNAIALTGAVVLLVDPLAIADVGFWLTFGATTAIVVGASRIHLPAESWRRTALTVLLASIWAEVALAPVVAMIFQRVTLAGLLLNFVAVPCMTLVQMAGITVVGLDALGASELAGPAGRIAHVAAMGLTGSARLLDVAPWLTWRVPSPSPMVLVAYYAALLGAVGATAALVPFAPLVIVRRLSSLAAACLFLWIVAALPARVRARGDGRLHLTLVDVGQGDAMLVTFPNGRHLAIDTGGVGVGGEFDIGERVLGPSLRARNLLRLDYLAITHADPDHVGGARSLVRDFQPLEVWWGVPVPPHQPTALVRAEAEAIRATWRTLHRGDHLEIGGVELRVHHPPPPDWERQKVRNDDSLVMELRLGQVSLLLTGDIGREVEQELLPLLDPLPTVVLKVPHHGSGTSSSVEFLERVRPAVAVIGVGRANRYGHPVPYVLERYHRLQTEIFRTDLDGQVELQTDGSAVEVTTFTGRRWEYRN